MMRPLKTTNNLLATLLLSTAATALASQAFAQELKMPPVPFGVLGLSKDLQPPMSASATPAATPVPTQTAIPTPPPAPEPLVPTQPATNASATPVPAPTVAPIPAATPAFALSVELAERITRDRGLSREDRDALTKFYDGRQGAPLWVDAKGINKNGDTLRAEFEKSVDYALTPSSYKVALSTETTNVGLADSEIAHSTAALRYARHARGGRMDPTALSNAIDRKAQLLPSAEVLAALANGKDSAETLRGFHPRHPQFEALRQKLLKHRAGETVVELPPAAASAPVAPNAKAKSQVQAQPKAPSAASIERKLVTNMEMWRWMPDMGAYHIQSNIPEYQFRVVREGKVVHTERIIVGKPVTMTPMFSDEMRLVVFKPFWNVPESIKWKELQPQLMRSSGALSKAGLKAQINGRDVDPGAVEWDLMDMRQVHIFQPPGPANALGQVKFLFPNKHDVYMHDTPTKNLFNTTVRSYSHGCMRVRDPLKFAEVILGNDKGWSREQINRLANTGPDNNEVKLDKKVPVHVTYFTAWVDADGKMQTANDIYGHENRVQLGIEGKTHLIAQQKEEKFAPPTREERARIAQQRRQTAQQQDPIGNMFKSLFNF
ncbi:MAG: L,D-transpeptidase family protein [Hyphomicrobiaceae bacterium]|nr:L,D-transpeptidase family protein [Hyphomicrobiaceae bacterium]